MTTTKDHFRRVSQLLEAQGRVAAGTRHSCSAGKLWERFLQEFLSPHLPGRLQVVSGEIIDSAGSRSGQLDCIITDKSVPFIYLGSTDHVQVLAEGTLAAIEVKTNLTRKELLSSLAACNTVKSLVRKGTSVYRKGSADIRAPHPIPILYYIFAYDGISLDKLLDYCTQYAFGNVDGHTHPGSEFPDAVCVLTKGLLLRSSQMPIVKDNTVTMPPVRNLKMSSQHLKKDALYGFFRRIAQDVIPLRMDNLDLDAYYAIEDIE